MTTIEREQLEALARKSVILREAWLRERQALITEQLAANDAVKERWRLADPIEIQQAGDGKREK